MWSETDRKRERDWQRELEMTRVWLKVLWCATIRDGPGCSAFDPVVFSSICTESDPGVADCLKDYIYPSLTLLLKLLQRKTRGRGVEESTDGWIHYLAVPKRISRVTVWRNTTWEWNEWVLLTWEWNECDLLRARKKNWTELIQHYTLQLNEEQCTVCKNKKEEVVSYLYNNNSFTRWNLFKTAIQRVRCIYKVRKAIITWKYFGFHRVPGTKTPFVFICTFNQCHNVWRAPFLQTVLTLVWTFM